MERGLPRVAVDEPAASGVGGLRARAEELADRYEDLAAEAEAAAVRWRWATPTSGHGDVEPLRLERMGCAPGRWLHRPPPPWQEHEAIGFDALGRVVCVRQYDATGAVWLERFSSWSRDEVEVVCYRAPLECGERELPAELQSVMRMRLAGGKPVESERYMPPTGSCSRERYRHEGGRLARVEEDSCDEGGGLATVVKEVVYGEDGRITGVDALGTEGRHAVWRNGAQPHPARRDTRPPAPGRLRRHVCV
ncbi:MAG TPA: hypothetical protein VI006_14310 [Solirubrobacteraceae bacterium]